MKLSKSHAYLTFRISDDNKEIILQDSLPKSDAKTLGSEQVYDLFISCMPKDQARYAVYDLEYDLGLDGIRNKLIFIMWNPDSGKIKSRMLYASSKNALKLKLNGVHTEVQCTDWEELAFESIFAHVAPKEAKPVVKQAVEE
ncbi:hypothetical protein BC833DRAFT_610060 [Globomyces pollinis-pini]|nr:hypothetical protein BC833DRAFT_610060 [Globomyces pollinis-pini]